nr:MAG TPA: hypothetical protein [Caudoviricetes sp.]
MRSSLPLAFVRVQRLLLHGPSGEARFLNGRPWKSPRAKFFSPPTKNKKSLKTAELQRKEANNGNSGNL